MKTAIKELIERIEKQMSAISDDPNLTERALYDSYFNCKNWAIEFLEKEKQQIIEDFYAGRDDWERKYPDATNYYNQTYNQNK